MLVNQFSCCFVYGGQALDNTVIDTHFSIDKKDLWLKKKIVISMDNEKRSKSTRAPSDDRGRGHDLFITLMGLS